MSGKQTDFAKVLTEEVERKREKKKDEKNSIQSLARTLRDANEKLLISLLGSGWGKSNEKEKTFPPLSASF